MDTRVDNLPDTRLDGAVAWRLATVCLIMMSVAFGAPYILTVALKQIAAELGGQRSIPSAAMSLVQVGTGVGGLLMGWIAERIGVRWTVVGGAVMLLLGLLVSSGGTPWQLYIGYGLLIGLFGTGALNAPMYVYVTRWFERRRGTALSLISSGQYIAGAIWPPVFERTIAMFGWQHTMIGFGVLAVAVIIPMALFNLTAAPPNYEPASRAGEIDGGQNDTLFGLPSNLVFVALLLAAFLCCIPMALPQSHLIAFCGDLGMLPARGALALSLLLACAFISRQFWGWLSDRYGGLPTLVICSLAQTSAIAGFLFTQSETGLFTVAAVFGLGFSGLIPAYILTIRELFAASEAYWRMPMLLLTGMSGMGAGSWIGGVIYDHSGSYAPAFATGLAANFANLAILLLLFASSRRTPARPSFA